MPITYATPTITAIQDGDAITAAILNGPSVSLSARTDEILRSSNYDDFVRDYTTSNLVKLTPTLEGVDPTVTFKTNVKSIDGTPTGTYRRYYSVALNGAALSIYAEASTGSRYVIPGSSFSSYFSDSSANVLSKHLVSPGDGIYLKVPLKNTGDDDASVSNYPDLVSPKNETESLTNQYVATPQANLPELIKLPELTEITLLGETKEDLIALIDANFASVSQISIDATNDALSITNDVPETLTLRLNGVQGAICEVTHIRNSTSGTDCILTVVASTGPIFRNIDTNNPTPMAGLTLSIFNGAAEQDTATSTPLNSATGYLIVPKTLDRNYRYIPLVRLTESSMEVGDTSFNLVANYDYTNGDVPLLNLNGAPAGANPTQSDAGEMEHTVYLLDPQPLLNKGVHTIKMPIATPDASNEVSTLLFDTDNLLLSKIKRRVISGDTLTLVSARYTPIANIATAGSLLNLQLDISCFTTGLASASLSFSVNEVTTSANSLVDYGCTLDILPESGSTFSVAGGAGLTSLGLSATISESLSANMLSGAFYLEIDLLVS